MRQQDSFFGFGVAAALLLASLVATRDARGSVALALSIDELARAASSVARVTPLGATTAWEDGRIVTSTRVRVEAVVAGGAVRVGEELTVKTRGGVVGDVGQSVEGEAQLASSAPSLLFLAPRADRTYTVAGRAQGQPRATLDGAGREAVRVLAHGAGGLVRRPAPRSALPLAIELDGAEAPSVVRVIARAWETTHAR